jgi:hypothetical protein
VSKIPQDDERAALLRLPEVAEVGCVEKISNLPSDLNENCSE